MDVVDIDAHLIEPAGLWLDGLPPALKRRAPRVVKDSWGFDRLMVESRLYPRPEGPGRAPRRVFTEEQAARHVRAVQESASAPARLACMQRQGISRALLLPSQSFALSSIRDLELAAACCRVYNEFVADFCSGYEGVLMGAAILPFQDLAKSLVVLKAAVNSGLRAVCVRAHPCGTPNLDDLALDPLYSAVEEAGLPIVVHEAAGFEPVATMGVERYESGLITHAVWHPFQQMLGVLSFIMGGVLQRHPRLKVVFAESGSGWVPYWLSRLDRHCETFAWEVPWLKHLPSEYFRRQCLVAVEASDIHLPFAVEQMGIESVAFATDYPHSDSDIDNCLDAEPLLCLSAEQRQAFLGGNALALFQPIFPVQAHTIRHSHET